METKIYRTRDVTALRRYGVTALRRYGVTALRRNVTRAVYLCFHDRLDVTGVSTCLLAQRKRRIGKRIGGFGTKRFNATVFVNA